MCTPIPFTLVGLIQGRPRPMVCTYPFLLHMFPSLVHSLSMWAFNSQVRKNGELSSCLPREQHSSELDWELGHWSSDGGPLSQDSSHGFYSIVTSKFQKSLVPTLNSLNLLVQCIHDFKPPYSLQPQASIFTPNRNPQHIPSDTMQSEISLHRLICNLWLHAKQFQLWQGAQSAAQSCNVHEDSLHWIMHEQMNDGSTIDEFWH